MADPFLIYYFGDDEAYYKALEAEFHKMSYFKTKLKRFFETDEKKIQSLFLRVFRDRPDVVLIDFSTQTQNFLHLSRLLIRTPLEHKLVSVGLVDYLSPTDIIHESVATGVSLTHVKSTEIFDLAYDLAKLINPDGVPDNGFAVASLNETIEASIRGKVGFVNREGIHIETNFPLTKGQKLKLNHYWTEGHVVPSEWAIVNKVTSKGLFYHFSQGADLDFMFKDPLVPIEGADEKVQKMRKLEWDDEVFHHRKQLRNWIKENQEESNPKKAKILVVDYDFAPYKDKPRSDRQRYLIRCISHFRNIIEELERFAPQFIAFTIQKVPYNGTLKNTMDELVKLVETVKEKSPDRPPFILVYNSDIDSKELKASLNYPQVMASSSEMDMDVLLRMLEMYENKLASTHLMNPTDKEVFYINKHHPASMCEIKMEIKVLKMSETDMLFQCETVIPEGTNIHISGPIDMYVHCRPLKSQSATPLYSGLIHSLGELEKIELRKYVQSIFFRDHDAQIQAELNEYKLLNENKLEEKVKSAKSEEERTEEGVPAPKKVSGQ